MDSENLESADIFLTKHCKSMYEVIEPKRHLVIKADLTKNDECMKV